MDLCKQKLVSYSEDTRDKLKVLGIVKLPVKSKSDVEKELTCHVVENKSARITGTSFLTKLGPN